MTVSLRGGAFSEEDPINPAYIIYRALPEKAPPRNDTNNPALICSFNSSLQNKYFPKQKINLLLDSMYL